MKTPEDRIAAAQAAFEAGFASKAAQKRALDDLNRAYSRIRDAAHSRQIARANERFGNDYQARSEFFAKNDVPFDLHQVRDRHVTIITFWTDAETSRTLVSAIALRAAIKEAPIAPAPAKPEAEVKAEAVRKSIIEEMEARKAQFIEGLDIARHFNGLPVSVNAHYVHGHKGTVFIRHFFYLRGKLTPLNMILAIADAYKAEKEAGK